MSCIVAGPEPISALLSYLHSGGMDVASCQRLERGIHTSNLEAYAHRYRIPCTLTVPEGLHTDLYQLDLKPSQSEVLNAVQCLAYQISDHRQSGTLPVMAYLDKIEEELKEQLIDARYLPPDGISLIGMLPTPGAIALLSQVGYPDQL